MNINSSSGTDYNRAAFTIQVAWRKFRARPLEKGAMGEWLKSYGKDFVAHAFGHSNFEKILERGKIVPAEYLFREMGSVEYEAYGASRATVELPPLSGALIEKIKSLPYKNAGLSFVPRSDAPPKASWNLTELLQIQTLEKAFREGYPKATPIQRHHLQILRDHYAAIRIDLILAKHFQTLLTSAMSYEDAYQECISARMGAISPSKLNPEIRAGKNCIYWHYGPIVALRGDGSEITGATRGSEAILWTPFENKENPGEPFCLDLTHQKVALLAPKALLPPPHARKTSSGYRFH